jgi:hypothetical protein
MIPSQDVDRLFDLLPAIYRQRDADEQGQLKALLRVIAEQVNNVEADIAQLYENWFIETCQQWVIPYIGDLVGYQSVSEIAETGDTLLAEELAQNKITISRREVGNTIHNRRRKGTLSLLEQLAWDVASWPAHAVEFFKLLDITQNINARQLARGRTVDVRDNAALAHIGGPFVREAHSVDVRHIVSPYTPGRYNLPSVGLFIWRLKAYPIICTPAYCMEEVSPSCYTFSVLGNDAQLYTNPQTSRQPASELNFAAPIGRHTLRKHLRDYYGEGKSFAIWTIEGQERLSPEPAPGAQHAAQHPPGPHTEGDRFAQRRRRNRPAKASPRPEERATLELVKPERIVVADLSDWRYRPLPEQVAVDPVLGRIMFPTAHPPEEVIVSYYYGFSADMGGGAYHRPVIQPSAFTLYPVGKHLDSSKDGNFNTIQDALKAWNQAKQYAPTLNAIIEIVDSGVYTEQFNIRLAKDEYLTIRAADRQRPVIRLIDWQENRPDSLRVRGEERSRFTLDGLLITGRPVQIEGTLTGVHLRHCTLVPGWGLHDNCEPRRPAEPSLELFLCGECVTIEHCITGAILVYENETQNDPLRITISDSIVDATNFERSALSQPVDDIAYATVSILRCTIFGHVRVHDIQLAENSIFAGRITVARRQLGCMRFCSFVRGSRTPRRYHCQPDLVIEAAQKRERYVQNQHAREAYIHQEIDRVRPRFTSVRYGNSAYCQLAQNCAAEIKSGADDQSEMGVFHDLFQPQRAANLRTRLDEYTPAGMETGIIYMS